MKLPPACTGPHLQLGLMIPCSLRQTRTLTSDLAKGNRDSFNLCLITHLRFDQCDHESSRDAATDCVLVRIDTQFSVLLPYPSNTKFHGTVITETSAVRPTGIIAIISCSVVCLVYADVVDICQ
ncbi:hypothetical protein TNCV_797981 [Trichonephila clavipes]|nr:hypothetical protein TNCV_797981 [Trichonephila clavipes]